MRRYHAVRVKISEQDAAKCVELLGLSGQMIAGMSLSRVVSQALAGLLAGIQHRAIPDHECGEIVKPFLESSQRGKLNVTAAVHREIERRESQGIPSLQERMGNFVVERARVSPGTPQHERATKRLQELMARKTQLLMTGKAEEWTQEDQREVEELEQYL